MRTIAVTGGKGGIGKTSFSLNLSLALSALGHRVTLIDADFGLANLDVHLGISPKKNLQHFFMGKAKIEELVHPIQKDFQVIFGGRGLLGMTRLTPFQIDSLRVSVERLGTDYLIWDTAAGIDLSVCQLAACSDEVQILLSPDPASLTDAYAIVKLLRQHFCKDHLSIVTNMVSSVEEGHRLFANISRVTEKFLDVVLKPLGHLPFDTHLGQSIRRQRPLLMENPQAPFSRALQQIARQMVRERLVRGIA